MIIVCIVLFIICILLVIKNKIDFRIYEEELMRMLSEDTFPCVLRIMINYGQEEEAIVTSFAQYAEKKIVDLIWNRVEEAKTPAEKNTNGKLIIHPHAVLFNIGGKWVWVV